jgi:acetone carboxylase gamma subunit
VGSGLGRTKLVVDATEFLHIESRQDGPVFVCRCGAVLGDARRNFKSYTLMEEGPVHEAGLRVNPYRVSDRFVFRQFYCPRCLLRLETEVALKDEPVLWDIHVDVSREP